MIGSVFYKINSTHAEVNVINKNKHKLNKTNKKWDLFVFKFDCNGSLKNSKPCMHCLNFIKKS